MTEIAVSCSWIWFGGGKVSQKDGRCDVVVGVAVAVVVAAAGGDGRRRCIATAFDVRWARLK